MEALSAAREPMLRAYRDALRDSGNLLCDPPHWDACVRQAESIVDDCVAALTGDWEQPDDRSLTASAALGRSRALRGVHPAHSFHACTLLFEIFLTHAQQAVLHLPRETADRLLTRVLRVYNSSVGLRVDSAMQAYDAFLLTEVKKANSDDRLQLARDIHDHLGSSLALTLRCLELHEAQELDGAPGKRLKSAYDALREALRYTRELVGDLRISMPRTGIEASLREFTESAAFDTPTTRIQVSGDEQWLDQRFRAELYVVLRECLRNSFNHAEASVIDVVVDIAPREVTAYVEDDGKGFDVAAVLRSDVSSGLSSVRERVVGLGGRARWTSTPDTGTRVILRIPYVRSGDASVRA
ncbi:sensor histidine kinase [Streptomyces barringtoniae]|uniref:sensor histidine kinase n=1 Tax=Streptomyces barringtoniae TaxID=2892029 RepID=UPI001E2F6409|nr:ATP-binding protein [Streptomyces barringtoniae]MCC5476908.1 histidine kinase [Streptomyces barringtoniae]